MSEQDRSFIRTFTLVLVGLAVLAVILIILANSLRTDVSTPGGDSMAQQAIEQRIAPVGEVVTTADAGSDTAAAQTASAGRSAKDVYQTTCASCHDTGVAGAPKVGDTGAWSQRAEKGLDGMLEIAVNGKGAMPPRGGGDYSEAELRAAIEYMLSETGVEAAGGAASAAGEPDAPAADQPAGVSLAQGKELVNQSCASCHVPGVAGAPRIGDQAAWTQRAEKGMDGMLEIAIKGKGAMPPRGASTASDEALRAAIQYMLQESGVSTP